MKVFSGDISLHIYFFHATLMVMMSSRMDSRLLSLAKFHIFCTVSLVAIIFIICIDGIIYADSQNSVELKQQAVSQVLQTHTIERQFIKSAVTRKALRMPEDVPDVTEVNIDDASPAVAPFTVTEVDTEDTSPVIAPFDVTEVDTEDTSSVVAPFNLTEEERISWFRGKLPQFLIFDSDEKALQFHGRVLEFFNHECEIQFFMTWISPVSSFGSKEFLSMESVFRAHPRGCLMILSRTMDSRRGYTLLKPLQDRGFKVHAVTPDLSFLFKNTPAEAWFAEMKAGNRDPGEIPLAQNLSNLLRLAVLYKHGGVYLDTDFIVVKSFSGLRNSIGAQSMDALSKNWTRLNNAVLVFDMNHPLLHKFIEEFALTFDGNKWGHNGPYLVSRVVQRVQDRPGYNFTVLPPMAFYPVDWTRIRGLFKKPENRADTRWVNAKLLQLSGETYGVHLWNKQSSRVVIEEGSIMQRLISDHCVICKDIYSSKESS